MNLLSSVFKSVFKRRDVYILLAFSLLPLLVGPLSDVQEGKQAGSFTSSAVAYFNSGIETQFQLVLPSLILGFIVSSVFHDEIRSGIMFLYKDIKRSTIFNAKLLSLFAVYGIYLGLSCIVSILAYYLVILPKFGGDAHFLAVAGTGQTIFLQLLSNIAIHLILITLIAAISIKKSTLPAVLTGVLFTLISMTAPMLNGSRYTFPNTYPKFITTLGFFPCLFISLALSILYLGLAYNSARRHFNKIEY